VNPGATDVATTLGDAVRRRRRELGMTLAVLRGRTGLSKGFLSQLESGRANPTLETLIRVASALDCTPAVLFGTVLGGAGGPAAGTVRPTRRAARAAGRLDSATDGRSYRLTGSRFGCYEVMLCDGTPAHHAAFVHHPGAEFCYVVAGTLRVELGERVCVLTAGESLHFAADTPHRLRAQTSATRFLLAV